MKQLTLTLLLLLPSGLAFAHSPGISVVELEITPRALIAEINIARTSVDRLVKTLEQEVSRPSGQKPSSPLERIAREIVELRVDGRRVQPDDAAVDASAEDGVRFELLFHVERARTLELRSPMIEALGRGHRQLVSVLTEHGLASSELLSADNAALVIDWPSSSDAGRPFLGFFVEGVWHIWVGFDHILFLMALLLPVVLTRADGRWMAVAALKPVLLTVAAVVTAFTIAHSLTLTLAALGWVRPPPRWVEPVIAATVIVAALNNVCPLVQGRRWLVAFGLGLVHGFGFAGVLEDIGLPAGAMVPALAGFNIGVELGQLAIVLLLVPGAYAIRSTWLYQRVLLVGGSAVVAIVALVWLIERTLEHDLTTFV